MYRCEHCKRIIGPRIPQRKVVVEKRSREVGWEIAAELVTCPTCEPKVKAIVEEREGGEAK